MKTMGKLTCVLLAAALLLSACATRPVPAPQEDRSTPSGTADFTQPAPDTEAPEPQPQPQPVPVEDEPAAPSQETPADKAKPAEELPGDDADMPPAVDGDAPEDTDVLLHAQESATTRLSSLVAPLASAGGSLADIDLSIPSTFRVTRPTEKITTTYATYFITGTSDPNQPLTIGGNAITRNGTKGTWGVLVNLSVGTNTFTVRQGDQSETLTIVRSAGGGVSTISEIRQSSMYPSTQGGVKTGETMLVECVAPSGGTVVASFEGRSVTLQQVASASAGVPATYRGQLLVEGDYPTGATTRIGKVSYELRYNGTVKTFQSTGEMYVAGVGSRIAVRVTDAIGTTYNSTKQLGVFRERLKRGSTDYVAGEDNEYFQLSSGGYLPKGQAEIITGQVSIQNTLSAVAFSSTGRAESYTFRGTGNSPVFVSSIKDNVFYLTIYNTTGTPAADTSASRLFSQAGVTDNGSSVTYSFPVKNAGLYWGYNMNYDNDGNLVLRFQYKPSINAGSSTPLAGVVIMLDPGHGGSDPGAQGVAAGVGPNEATLNMAHAYATRDALTAMGATVYLTHTGQTTELHERLERFEQSEADLFISLHHNSLAESTDANKVTGTEVYYHTAISQNLAGRMLSAVSAGLGRTARHYRQGYYRVTILPHSPSILLELGYISNPVEYEKACNTAEIQKAAQAIADGVVNTLK